MFFMLQCCGMYVKMVERELGEREKLRKREQDEENNRGSFLG